MNAHYLKMAIEYRNLIDHLLDEDGFADIVLYGGNIVNVITKEIYPGDVAIKGQYIMMVGDASKLIGEKTKVIDVRGKYISPGFIDSHMHFESSMLTITEFSKLSIPSGTTTIIADPHEIGNALGPIGIKAMADEAGTVPNRVKLVVPAMTPDSPTLETAGVDINSKDMEDLLSYRNIAGIGELQGFSNVKNVYKYTPDVIDDLIASTTYAVSLGKIVDGNAPELFAQELAAHIISCGGGCSCHETTTKEECIEKLRYGVYVFMREGSTQKNMAECIKALTEEGLDSRRLILATDDMLSDDLAEQGHMNEIIRRTIAQGVKPEEAIQMATINPATYFGLNDIGVLAPGKIADIAIIEDIVQMNIAAVFIKGKLISTGKDLLINMPLYKYPDIVKNSVKCKPVTQDQLEIYKEGIRTSARCIVLIPDQNLSDAKLVDLKISNEKVQCDVNKDISYICCVERYGKTGNIGKAFVTGFGLKEGAFAESIAHDTHNIIAIGTNTKDMAAAINRVIEMKGGIAIAKGGTILNELSLPVGGLITDELTANELSSKMQELNNVARDKLGCKVHAPFMHLSFLALSTSPKWKITDQGLIDVNSFEILSSIF